MEKLKQQTVKAINTDPHSQGIKKLLRLMGQYPQPQYSHQIIKFSCLGLLQMQHDWINIKKYIIEWKMINKFGINFLKRMRQRVLIDDDGGLNKLSSEQEKQNYVMRELEMCFEKYWQFNSPKKQAPNYQQQIKPKNKSILIKKKDQVADKQKPKEQIKVQPQFKPSENISIKPRQSNFMNPNRNLSLKLGKLGALEKKNTDRNQNMISKPMLEIQPQVQTESVIHPPQAQDENFYERPNKQEPQLQKPKLKVKTSAPHQQQSYKDTDIDFEMSAVRTRQQPIQHSPIKSQCSNISRAFKEPKPKYKQLMNSSFDEFDDEFAFRTIDKKSRTLEEGQISQKKDFLRELEEQNISKEKQTERRLLFRNFLTEQKMNMIESKIPFENRFKKVFEKEGLSVFQLLNSAVDSM